MSDNDIAGWLELGVIVHIRCLPEKLEMLMSEPPEKISDEAWREVLEWAHERSDFKRFRMRVWTRRIRIKRAWVFLSFT